MGWYTQFERLAIRTAAEMTSSTSVVLDTAADQLEATARHDCHQALRQPVPLPLGRVPRLPARCLQSGNRQD